MVGRSDKLDSIAVSLFTNNNNETAMLSKISKLNKIDLKSSLKVRKLLIAVRQYDVNSGWLVR